MPAEQTITIRAADRKLTIGELREFLTSIPPDAAGNAIEVKITTKGIGGIKTISATLPTMSAP